MPSSPTFSPATACTSTTGRCRSWRRALAKPRLADCGPMSATSGHSPARPSAALFFYSPDRKGEHPQAHLQDFRGVIHADGYAGFNELFVSGRIVEAGCWAHVRRKFFDVHAATGSPIAKEALDRDEQDAAPRPADEVALPVYFPSNAVG